MRVFYDIKAVDVPVLENGQVYIYILENSPQGNIKIGRSSNMQQRLQTLSGSNSGGNHITKCAVSDATWLYTLERIAHVHFAAYRIDGTEWFDGEKVPFDDVAAFVDSLFLKEEYAWCNEVRRDFSIKMCNKPLELIAA